MFLSPYLHMYFHIYIGLLTTSFSPLTSLLQIACWAAGEEFLWSPLSQLPATESHWPVTSQWPPLTSPLTTSRSQEARLGLNWTFYRRKQLGRGERIGEEIPWNLSNLTNLQTTASTWKSWSGLKVPTQSPIVSVMSCWLLVTYIILSH